MRGQHFNSVLEGEFGAAQGKEGVKYAKTVVGKLA